MKYSNIGEKFSQASRKIEILTININFQESLRIVQRQRHVDQEPPSYEVTITFFKYYNLTMNQWQFVESDSALIRNTIQIPHRSV